MLVSIIIPAYNAAATLARCLEACLAQTHAKTEIIVVDDGSTDDTSRIAQEFPVHCVRQENRGPAAARNRGAAEAKGAVLAYTDADCVPDPQWIERLLEGFEETVGAVGGTYAIANPDSLLAQMVHEEIAQRHRRLRNEVDFLGSFNVAYLKDAFEQTGGFDETFTAASAEDNDLAYRLQDAGYRLRFTASARVAHFHPTRLMPYLHTQMNHGRWRVKLYIKHPARARQGDQYAGPTDLLAPPLALVLLVLAPLTALSALAAPVFVWAAPSYAAALVFFTLLRAPQAVGMARHAGDIRMLGFAGVAAIRDIARALGLLQGMYRLAIGRNANP